jgi:hypothetical protein
VRLRRALHPSHRHSGVSWLIRDGVSHEDQTGGTNSPTTSSATSGMAKRVASLSFGGTVTSRVTPPVEE